MDIDNRTTYEHDTGRQGGWGREGKGGTSLYQDCCVYQASVHHVQVFFITRHRSQPTTNIKNLMRIPLLILLFSSPTLLNPKIEYRALAQNGE